MQMKLDRLLAITMILIQKRRVQAKELADMFDVSVRTIYRDIEAINQAGIPIVSYQGANGGIGIIDGYRLDKNVLTKDELASIAIALKSVSTGYADSHANMVLGKLQSMLHSDEAQQLKARSEQVLIDLSPWEAESSQKEKITLLKDAIATSQVVSFHYQPASGVAAKRLVEPHTLVLKGQKWYLYAFCTLRQDFRMFKVARMKKLAAHPDQTFQRKEIHLEQFSWDLEKDASQKTVPLVLRFAPRAKHMAEEYFGVEQVTDEEDGSCTVRVNYPEDEWLYGFLLGFGPMVEILEPAHLRAVIRDRAQKIVALYENSCSQT